MKWEWLSAPAIQAPELRATWARLEMIVGGDPVTLVEDVESGSSRRSIYVSLYPLAEWIAYNWWALQANSRPSTDLSKLSDSFGNPWNSFSRRYQKRHGLRGAGDGFLWPNLFLLPEGDTTRVVWRADAGTRPERPTRFVSSGEAIVESRSLQQRLSALVESVIARLAEQGVGETPLTAEWASVTDIDDDEAAFCVAAARLGLDPYSEALKYQADIMDAAAKLGHADMLRDFLDAVEPDQIPSMLAWVVAATSDIERDESRPNNELSELRSRITSPPRWEGLPPWERGWAQARLLRDAAAVQPHEAMRVEKLVRSKVRSVAGAGLQALGGAKDDVFPPLVLTGQHGATAKRFTIARALWHLIWQRSDTFLVTSAHTDRQKTERAFAAELLAPASGITMRLADDNALARMEEPELDEIARHFGVSPLLIQHQIENQVVRAG